MSEKLSWAEIETRHGGEWVVLVDHTWDTTELSPAEGVVVFHSRDRQARDAFLSTHRYPDAAVLFVGEPEQPEAKFVSANVVRPL